MSKELEYFQDIIKVDEEALTLANKEKNKKRDVMLHRHWLNIRKNSIEQALKDYQEIKEIAKHYNWDDITSEIFNVKTDKKYRDLFNSAIVNIQEDYRKARAFEIIEEKEVDIYGIKNSIDVYDYNAGIENEDNFDKRLLTLEEYELVKKEVLL